MHSQERRMEMPLRFEGVRNTFRGVEGLPF
jgi:hypothetical protein